MEMNAKRLPLLAVKLTRAESMAMNVAIEAGLYPKQAGFPVEAVRRAIGNQPKKAIAVLSQIIFCPPIQ